jgi:hypothetical protein
MKQHNVHRVILVAVVAVVLKLFHALPDEQRLFRPAAILKKSQILVVLTGDRQTDMVGLKMMLIDLHKVKGSCL